MSARIPADRLRKRSMARKYSKGASKKVEGAMRKRKRGTLKSGRSGKKVKSRKQAIAIACLRLFTFLPLRPLFSVPRLRLRIAPSTFFDAPLEYFRAMLRFLNRSAGIRADIHLTSILTRNAGARFRTAEQST